ncbi:intracellular septation protein A [Pseudoalteromonas luteoviolacea B = ATCC 29581]|nr:intracellular septation protein A [Pseudoalteromonas luteoviolacea B = ATCC 29581]
MALLFEYLPLILFFVIYKSVDIFWATGVLIIAAVIQLIYYQVSKGKIENKHWIFAGIAVVLGGMTLAFHDEQFIQWKATLVYALLGSALLFGRLLFKTNLVEKALLGLFSSIGSEKGETNVEIKIPAAIFNQLLFAWIILFYFIAGLNLYVAFNFSLDTWVNFKVFGLMGITFVAIMLTMFKVYKYLPTEE